LDEVLQIVQASEETLKILGTVRMYLEADVLGCRRLVEFAVIGGEASNETLISLQLLKKWNMIHSSFPHESITDFVDRKHRNKLLRFWAKLSHHFV